MASPNKKRKLNFQKDWTDKFFFIEVENGAFCLLCPKTQKIFTALRKSNFERHYANMHSDVFNLSEELRSLLLAEKIQQLDAVKSEEMNSKLNKKNEKESTEKCVKIASYRLAYQIAKNSRPFTEGKFLQACFDEIIPLLCPELKSKFEKIALSRRSIGRRIEKIHNHLNSSLKMLIEGANCYSIALDESCDVRDTAQLCLFIRGINKKFEIFEELLSIQPMMGRTTGKDFFNEFMKCKENYNINMIKLASITTDGCPSLMGRINGFVALLQNEHKKLNSRYNLWSIHCLIHQESLCKNQFKLESVTKIVIKFVNFIRGSSLRHRQFIQFLKKSDARFSDVFHYHQVRWLSIGEVVSRVYALISDIVLFLNQIQNNDFPEFKDNLWLNECAFAVDILTNLNQLNLKLQGKNQFAFDMYKYIIEFTSNLHTFYEHMSRGQILERNFPTLFERFEVLDVNQMPGFSAVLLNLFNDFKSRFEDIKQICKELNNTYNLLNVVFPDDDQNNPEINQYKMIQNDEQLKERYNTLSKIDFFASLNGQTFKHIKYQACRAFVLFGSTYNCESLFSMMKINKSAHRSAINEESLDCILKICTTKITIDFEKLAADSDE